MQGWPVEGPGRWLYLDRVAIGVSTGAICVDRVVVLRLGRGRAGAGVRGVVGHVGRATHAAFGGGRGGASLGRNRRGSSGAHATHERPAPQPIGQGEGQVDRGHSRRLTAESVQLSPHQHQRDQARDKAKGQSDEDCHDPGVVPPNLLRRRDGHRPSLRASRVGVGAERTVGVPVQVPLTGALVPCGLGPGGRGLTGVEVREVDRSRGRDPRPISLSERDGRQENDSDHGNDGAGHELPPGKCSCRLYTEVGVYLYPRATWGLRTNCQMPH